MQFASLPRLLPQLFFVLLILAAHLRMQAQAQSGTADPGLERQVKAAYLVKFAAFVEWPDGSFVRPDSPLLIGVMGADALAEQLERSAAGHSANGHPLQVKRLKKGEPAGQLHMLFVGAHDKASLQDVLAATRSQPLLTVSDSEEAHAMGSIVNFLLADERLRFEVALKPAAAARIRISARMLSAAYRVAPGAI
jgi:hypothetical protein